MSTGRFALKIGISVSGHVGDDPEHALNKMARYTVCVSNQKICYTIKYLLVIHTGLPICCKQISPLKILLTFIIIIIY